MPADPKSKIETLKLCPCPPYMEKLLCHFYRTILSEIERESERNILHYCAIFVHTTLFPFSLPFLYFFSFFSFFSLSLITTLFFGPHRTIFWYLPHYFPGILDPEDPKLFPYFKIHSALKKLFQKRVHGMTFQYIQSFSKSGIRLDSKFDIRPARYWELDIPDILNIQRKFMTNF